MQIVYRPAESDGFAGAFADSIIYGRRDLGEQDRAAISWKNLLASVSFLATGAGQRGFPSVRHAKSFEDACEIVGAPAMTQYERSRDGLWVLAYLQFTWRLPEQLLEAVVHVQLLEEDLHQGRRPPEQAVAETAERTARGRTSRRQRFVVASVGAGLRRFWPARGARPERADVGARMGDFVSGDFRREGMGAPGIGDSPAQLTASRPVPCSDCVFRGGNRDERTRFRTTFGYGDTQNVIGRAVASHDVADLAAR